MRFLQGVGAKTMYVRAADFATRVKDKAGAVSPGLGIKR
jgi:hypothetical protein